MALQSSPQPARRANLVAAVGACALRVWRDPGFQTVLRKEAWQFVVNVSTEARAAAQTDSLTESLNRRGIAPVIAAAARQGQYALALVDLDRFKRINDALGHGAGDVVLANVARSISRSIGDAGTVARWGGEEFLIVLPQTSLNNALAVMERMRAEVEDEYAMDGVAQPVTISAGVAHGRQLAPKEELLRLADAKLYEAKASGRNVVFGADLEDAARD